MSQYTSPLRKLVILSETGVLSVRCFRVLGW